MTARPITALALATLAPHAAADFVQSTTGIPDARTTITFEEIPVKSGDPVTNQYAPLGITIDPYLYFDILKNDFPHITGHRVGYASLDPVIPFSVKFDQPRTSAAFAAASNTSNTTFEALLDGVVVEKAETKTALFNEDNFYGFTGIVFDEIRVTQFVLQGVIANVIVEGLNEGFGAGVGVFSEEEILAHAGIDYGGADSLEAQIGQYR